MCKETNGKQIHAHQTWKINEHKFSLSTSSQKRKTLRQTKVFDKKFYLIQIFSLFSKNSFTMRFSKKKNPYNTKSCICMYLRCATSLKLYKHTHTAAVKRRNTKLKRASKHHFTVIQKTCWHTSVITWHECNENYNQREITNKQHTYTHTHTQKERKYK